VLETLTIASREGEETAGQFLLFPFFFSFFFLSFFLATNGPHLCLPIGANEYSPIVCFSGEKMQKNQREQAENSQITSPQKKKKKQKEKNVLLYQKISHPPTQIQISEPNTK
jgi:hypothetical protein